MGSGLTRFPTSGALQLTLRLLTGVPDTVGASGATGDASHTDTLTVALASPPLPSLTQTENA